VTSRIGLGYDIHRLVPGRPLVLGGIQIPSEVGLEGHSDADVILHALMDALLGAAGLGDIGQHFPPGDDRFRGISSLTLLEQVRDLLDLAGFRLVNADIVVVAERPRIAPHSGAMRQCIADVLGTDSGTISIKATTNEGVGAEGRSEAISAQAVALLERTI
jgi:2-C-methyl-D-erythritol 2,4-cyclodiphosphate synthase